MGPRKVHPYYNFDRLFSYNGTFNIVPGGRGIGKTYGAQKHAIKNAITKGEQFIYLRRYKTEMTAARNTFFAAVEVEFPKHDFRVIGNSAQMAPISTRDEKKRVWATIGYFATLSTAQTLKSVAFPKVTLIIFDEFIIEKGALHYLPDEAKVFNNFYNTVDRGQDKTRVLFLANTVSIDNPYFLEYGILPKPGEEWITKADGFIVCHLPNSKAFADSIYQTKFGKFIQGTDYADYAVGNQFADNHDGLIQLKDGNARYQYTLETKKGSFSVWMDFASGEYYIQSKLPKSQDIFTLVAANMSTDKVLLTLSDRPMQTLRTSFRKARVSFDNPATRNVFMEIFKK